MKSLGLAPLMIGLLVACEKEVPFEHTLPFDGGRTSVGPTIDGGGVLLDAALTGIDGGDAGSAVEAPLAFSKPGLLRAIADCALDRYRAFEQRAGALREATRLWGDDPREEQRAAAQVAWRAAMESWQELELFRFGPAARALTPGGRDLRDQIYFFPDLNNCLVDQQIVSRAYENGAPDQQAAKGLGALEYLLFHDGAANSCSPALSINASGAWAQLDDAERTRRRAGYAAVLGGDLAQQSRALVDAWDPASGNFHGQFVAAGAGSPLFARDQDAFNVVDDALFYFDGELKDLKVGVPLGVSPLCPSERCPEAVESRFAQASNANIVANVAGFRLLFQGCGPSYTGLGFDDWLRQIGQAALADRMLASLVDAERAATGMSLPIEPLLSADPAQVMALYTALKAVTDPLKSEFVSSLNLELPTAAQGDND